MRVAKRKGATKETIVIFSNVGKYVNAYKALRRMVRVDPVPESERANPGQARDGSVRPGPGEVRGT